MSNHFGTKAFRQLRVRLLAGAAPAFYTGWLRARIIATPSWANFSEIRKVYKLAAMATELTGIKHTVDHEIPLRHERVCGLHVANNLRVVPYLVNASRGNYWCPEQIEMFSEPEQLRLI
jgi:hypothetical protein